jgi:hypothetical protein
MFNYPISLNVRRGFLSNTPFRKETLPYFRVLKNKHEEDDPEEQPSELNDVLSFVKKTDFLIGKEGACLIFGPMWLVLGTALPFTNLAEFRCRFSVQDFI